MRKIILRIKDIKNFNEETFNEIIELLVENKIDHSGILISITSGIGYVWKQIKENNEFTNIIA